ncbi:hypothetical protein V6N13_142001 [Hibiscus sabdariffa]
MKRRDNNAAIPPLQKKKHNDPSLHQARNLVDGSSSALLDFTYDDDVGVLEWPPNEGELLHSQLSMGERGDHVLCLTGETVGRPCGSIRSVDMCQLSLACSDGLARCRRRGNRPAEGTMGQAGQLWRIGSMVRLDHPIGFKSWSYTGLM